MASTVKAVSADAVTVIVHLEATEPGVEEPFVWWADAPSLSGFSAASDTLVGLIAAVRAALAELRPGSAARFQLAEAPDTSTGDERRPVAPEAVTVAALAAAV